MIYLEIPLFSSFSSSNIFRDISKPTESLSSILFGYNLFLKIVSYSKLIPWITPSLSFKTSIKVMHSLFLLALLVEKVKRPSSKDPIVLSFCKVELNNLSKKVLSSLDTLPSLYLR